MGAVVKNNQGKSVFGARACPIAPFLSFNNKTNGFYCLANDNSSPMMVCALIVRRDDHRFDYNIARIDQHDVRIAALLHYPPYQELQKRLSHSHFIPLSRQGTVGDYLEAVAEGQADILVMPSALVFCINDMYRDYLRQAEIGRFLLPAMA